MSDYEREVGRATIYLNLLRDGQCIHTVTNHRIAELLGELKTERAIRAHRIQREKGQLKEIDRAIRKIKRLNTPATPR